MDRKVANSQTDRRARPRRWRLEVGRISQTDGVFSLPCTIVDISEDGARVRFEQTFHLPEQFRLIDDRDRVAYTATLIWSEPPDYGLKFLGKDPL